MINNETKNPQNIPKYYCENCEYKTDNKKDYKRHLMTRKHINGTLPNAQKHECICGASYKYHSGLSRHKKVCQLIVKNPNDEYLNAFNTVIAENSELRNLLIKQQNQITELIDKVGPINNTTNNNTNNINTTNNFNLNFFLNEQCKDALNIMDFIKSLQIEFSEMEYTGKHGFVEGISNIVTNAIENMEITKRPIHCTDIKRETLYIKDNEEWNKDEDKHKMKTAIDILKQNNMAKMSDWIKENPGCHSYDNPKNDLFLGMVSAHANDNEKDTKKVIKNVAKSSTIPKSVMKEQSNIIKNKKKRKTKPNDETEQLEKTQKIEETEETDDFIEIIDE